MQQKTTLEIWTFLNVFHSLNHKKSHKLMIFCSMALLVRIELLKVRHDIIKSDLVF